MWKYVKSLEYPVNIKKKDLRMAKYLVTQYGGANGELAAAFRYLNQRYTMPDDKGKALLTDIGTEELAHVEMISAMIYQLLNGATLKELKEAGLESHYAEHGYGFKWCTIYRIILCHNRRPTRRLIRRYGSRTKS